MSLNDYIKHRVNASLLFNYTGKHVCLLGFAKNVDNGGRFFTLTTSDNQDVRVQMKQILRQQVSGLTEVHGIAASKNSIECDNIIVFSDEASHKFDMPLYHKALEYTQRHSNLYIQGGNAGD